MVKLKNHFSDTIKELITFLSLILAMALARQTLAQELGSEVVERWEEVGWMDDEDSSGTANDASGLVAVAAVDDHDGSCFFGKDQVEAILKEGFSEMTIGLMHEKAKGLLRKDSECKDGCVIFYAKTFSSRLPKEPLDAKCPRIPYKIVMRNLGKNLDRIGLDYRHSNFNITSLFCGLGGDATEYLLVEYGVVESKYLAKVINFTVRLSLLLVSGQIEEEGFLNKLFGELVYLDYAQGYSLESSDLEAHMVHVVLLIVCRTTAVAKYLEVVKVVGDNVWLVFRYPIATGGYLLVSRLNKSLNAVEKIQEKFSSENELTARCLKGLRGHLSREQLATDKAKIIVVNCFGKGVYNGHLKTEKERILGKKQVDSYLETLEGLRKISSDSIAESLLKGEYDNPLQVMELTYKLQAGYQEKTEELKIILTCLEELEQEIAGKSLFSDEVKEKVDYCFFKKYTNHPSIESARINIGYCLNDLSDLQSKEVGRLKGIGELLAESHDEGNGNCYFEDDFEVGFAVSLAQLPQTCVENVLRSILTIMNVEAIVFLCEAGPVVFRLLRY